MLDARQTETARHHYAPRPAFDKAAPDAWRQAPRPTPVEDYSSQPYTTILHPSQPASVPSMPAPAAQPAHQGMPPATSTTVPRTLTAHDPISAAAAREKLQEIGRAHV